MDNLSVLQCFGVHDGDAENEIAAEIAALEKSTAGLLKEILG